MITWLYIWNSTYIWKRLQAPTSVIPILVHMKVNVTNKTEATPAAAHIPMVVELVILVSKLILLITSTNIKVINNTLNVQLTIKGSSTNCAFKEQLYIIMHIVVSGLFWFRRDATPASSDCRSNSLGVRQSLRWIPDAQMTAHKSNGNSFASNGRQDGSAWTGVARGSWLQVDLGEFYANTCT